MSVGSAEGHTVDLGIAHAPSPLDVFILAGQSNMVGWNEKVREGACLGASYLLNSRFPQGCFVHNTILLKDGQITPAAALPWPGRILTFDHVGGNWTEVLFPNLHFGVHDFRSNASVGENLVWTRQVWIVQASGRNLSLPQSRILSFSVT